MGDESGPLSDDFFQWGTGATIRELFRLFNKERGGTLSQAHYARFCQLTEGQGCDDARWAQHCRSLGVAEPAGGMPLGCFGKLCAPLPLRPSPPPAPARAARRLTPPVRAATRRSASRGTSARCD